jgi:hypothetical protein
MFMVLGSFRWQQPETLDLKDGAHISLIGGNLGSRMMNYGHFETEMHVRYPEKSLLIRNMCDGGDTPGFRPHASRFSPWAFPGAEKFQTEYATNSDSEGHFDSQDQWLTRLQTDVIIAFFGYSESFQGKAGLENYKAELDAFIKYTLNQKCVQCHGSDKQKGKLRLDDLNWIKTGGKNGNLINVNNPAEGELIKRILLDDIDEHHMPPKEKAQLTDAELVIFQWWINTGASFDKSVAALAPDEKVIKALASFKTENQNQEKAIIKTRESIKIGIHLPGNQG